jgi:hypothetical protein
MNSDADLLDALAGLMGGDRPRRLGERTLEVVMALVNGRSGGVFAVADARLTLFASRGIDQHVLDAIETLWRRSRRALREGKPIYVPECHWDGELAAKEGPASLALFPVLDGGRLVALLYVDSVDPHFCPSGEIERLTRFSRVLAGAVRPDAAQNGAPAEVTGWESYLERTPVHDIERQKLLLLLRRNEWNIARVARLMGVTRRTIYLRLQRYDIPRERVYKTRLRAAAS